MMNVLRVLPKRVSVSLSSRVMHMSSTTMNCNVSQQLAAKLRSELDYEKEHTIMNNDFVDIFSKKSMFKVNDVKGRKEISLTKQFNNEKITVYLTTDDLANQEENHEMEDGEEEGVEEFPISLTVLIEKPNSGCMELNVTAEGDSFFIDNVAYSNDSSKMTDLSPVADYERKQLYSGPQFEQLDEQVQETFLEFLEERGFDKGFAQFAKQYLEYKEQNEYVNWLEGVEAFVKGK